MMNNFKTYALSYLYMPKTYGFICCIKPRAIVLLREDRRLYLNIVFLIVLCCASDNLEKGSNWTILKSGLHYVYCFVVVVNKLLPNFRLFTVFEDKERIYFIPLHTEAHEH